MTDQEFITFADHLEATYRDTLSRGPEVTHVDRLGWARWTSDYVTQRQAGQSHEPAIAEVTRRIHAAAGVLPPPGPAPTPGDRLIRPVEGYVRTEGRRWADDSGLRSFRVVSWFPALRCARDRWDETLRELDAIALGWHGVRIFWHLGTPWWTDTGYGVDPRWPNFDQVFTRFLQACRDRQLRVSLSAGDMQVLCPRGERDGAERDWYRRIAQLCASVDQQTVSWWGIWNEGWQNAATPSARYAAELSAIVQAVYPWGAHALSDPQEQEEPWALDEWSRPPANHTPVHGTRGYPDSLRRAFNLTYDEHAGGGRTPRLINQDEPVGAGPDVYARDDDPRHLFALYTLHRICGQMTTFFGGHGLKSWRQPGDLARDWGFRELPARWAQMSIPEDIQGWEIKPGHHGDAAIYPSSFADRGEGPERCDGAQTADRAWFVASGGRGIWQLRSRRDAHVRVWGPRGVIREGPASAGAVIFSADASTTRAVVIESLV